VAAVMPAAPQRRGVGDRQVATAAGQHRMVRAGSVQLNSGRQAPLGQVRLVPGDRGLHRLPRGRRVGGTTDRSGELSEAAGLADRDQGGVLGRLQQVLVGVAERRQQRQARAIHHPGGRPDQAVQAAGSGATATILVPRTATARYTSPVPAIEWAAPTRNTRSAARPFTTPPLLSSRPAAARPAATHQPLPDGGPGQPDAQHPGVIMQACAGPGTPESGTPTWRNLKREQLPVLGQGATGRAVQAPCRSPPAS
jgi:hypothetical protein